MRVQEVVAWESFDTSQSSSRRTKTGKEKVDGRTVAGHAGGQLALAAVLAEGHARARIRALGVARSVKLRRQDRDQESA